MPGKPSLYEVGHHYAVQPARGKPQICRITVLDRRRERLRDLSYEDAIAEGFRTRADFARYWMRLHVEKRHDPTGLTDDEVLELWQQLHGDTQVWVITFELKRPLQIVLPDTPTYLHRNPARGSTTDARQKAAGEPELMGTELKVGSIARARHAAEVERQQQLQHVHKLVERARAALEQAALADGLELGVLEQHVQELEARLRAA